PHFDSYDVFLFQAQGVREWKISDQKKFTLDKKSPIKIITPPPPPPQRGNEHPPRIRHRDRPHHLGACFGRHHRGVRRS
ncbi:MAG: hypothetical protein NTV94_11230, partial [Planctomycetota bacterium]|nr:hypothetical protein [Planctomycetota bacterium]